MKTLATYILQILSLSLLCCQSCAPVFSDMQSARTVGKNRVEITPSYSKNKFTYENQTENIQTNYGVQTAYGITNGIDIRARYEYIKLDYMNSFGVLGSDNHTQIFAIGPKFRLIKEYVAFYLPAGRAFGEYTENSWQVHPTLLFTIPAMKNKLDINSSIKYLVPLSSDINNNLMAFNFGLALSNNLQRWAIRPEYGILINPGGDGYFSHLSLGLSFAFGK